MKIRQAKMNDLDEIMKIYDGAKVFMQSHGNPTQWVNGYPSRAIVENDILENQLYVYTEDERIEAVFVYFTKPEPTYNYIEDGQWLNNLPYGTLHRIASAGRISGIGSECLAWCCTQCANMRGDTHTDNIYMQRVFEKNGFTKCGKVYMKDGTSRIAYQKCQIND